MYLIVFIVIVICMAVWVVVFLNRPSSTQRTEREARRGNQQFVFSSEKRFVASLKTGKPRKTSPESHHPGTNEKTPPSAVVSKTVPQKIQKTAPINKELSAENQASGGGPGKNKSPSSQEGLDFDHLSELIEDFFDEDKT